MSDIPLVYMDRARRLRTNREDTVGRRLLNRPLSPETNSIQGKCVVEAGEMIEASDGKYKPNIIRMKGYSDRVSDHEPTLAFVNEDYPDDVIVICPLLEREGWE